MRLCLKGARWQRETAVPVTSPSRGPACFRPKVRPVMHVRVVGASQGGRSRSRLACLMHGPVSQGWLHWFPNLLPQTFGL